MLRFAVPDSLLRPSIGTKFREFFKETSLAGFANLIVSECRDLHNAITIRHGIDRPYAPSPYSPLRVFTLGPARTTSFQTL